MGEFQAGDVVQLKSNGPRMTVDRRQDSGHLRCVWFNGADLREGLFVPESVFACNSDKAMPLIVRPHPSEAATQ